ncbi:SUF system Fe-S cluster assembly regulator [Xanthomonadaceae bacterium JHOS43]|nr:SUF system Fe-S cluster assembly regulator [Xanthomonadaceae bacterium JHOS43]MCX7562664.1 SUF system Fe-S cluster assembly regulator [Xanthomonadaceae bacterium XH05]
MLRVTRLTDYATLLLTVLATAPESVHSAAALAERTRLEMTTVSKVLKSLAQAGLVEGLRGVNGGYRMALAPQAISLFEIVEAIEGPLEMTECSGDHSRCVHEAHCGLAPHWRQVNDLIAEALRGMTLAQMLGPPVAPSDRRRIEVRLAT